MALRVFLTRCRSSPTLPSYLFFQQSQFSSKHNHRSTNGYHVELLDADTWQISSCLVRSWQTSNSNRPLPPDPIINNEDDRPAISSEDGDFDSIDSMRIRGHLLYKLEKGSKEFEECNLDFRRRKQQKKEKGNEIDKGKGDEIDEKRDEVNKKANLPHVTIKGREYYSLTANSEPKGKRSPTFNQLTSPYHEPFFLDIFLSRSSISASVVHRVTSKVVAVAHSISKDIKCDITSTKNTAACAHIGRVLASRALADDIHDVVYTPRRGDKIEGKLKIVLETIIENGINVKVKIKQKQHHKPLRVL